MIPTFDAQNKSGELDVAGMDLPQLANIVMDRGVAVVRRGFEREFLANIRQAVHAWGLKSDLLPPQTYIDENFHSIENGISPRQKAVHCYHAYNFNRIGSAASGLPEGLTGLFERLSVFQNRLTGQNGAFERDEAGRKQRPQFIHYPSGGGMFGRHSHPLEPQRIGLILGLSKRGEDFTSGSTWFEVDGRRFGTEDCHDIGDIILFRFDVPHWVTAVDQGERFDPSAVRGRWTAVLPFY